MDGAGVVEVRALRRGGKGDGEGAAVVSSLSASCEG